MKTEPQIKEMFCPQIGGQCVGEKCMACECVYTPPADHEALKGYKCLNPDCGETIPPKDKDSYDIPYCQSCGAGRVGDDYEIEPIYAMKHAAARDDLFRCSVFDTPRDAEIREVLLSNYPYVPSFLSAESEQE